MVTAVINAVIVEHAHERTEERNAYAKEIITDIEAQRKEAR